jgi:hypothetical protein
MTASTSKLFSANTANATTTAHSDQASSDSLRRREMRRFYGAMIMHQRSTVYR